MVSNQNAATLGSLMLWAICWKNKVRSQRNVRQSLSILRAHRAKENCLLNTENSKFPVKVQIQRLVQSFSMDILGELYNFSTAIGWRAGRGLDSDIFLNKAPSLSSCLLPSLSISISLSLSVYLLLPFPSPSVSPSLIFPLHLPLYPLPLISLYPLN